MARVRSLGLRRIHLGRCLVVVFRSPSLYHASIHSSFWSGFLAPPPIFIGCDLNRTLKPPQALPTRSGYRGQAETSVWGAGHFRGSKVLLLFFFTRQVGCRQPPPPAGLGGGLCAEIPTLSTKPLGGKKYNFFRAINFACLRTLLRLFRPRI